MRYDLFATQLTYGFHFFFVGKNSNRPHQVIQGQQLIRQRQRGSSHLYRYQLLPYRQTSHMKCIETSYEIYLILSLYIIDTCITLLTVLADWNIRILFYKDYPLCYIWLTFDIIYHASLIFSHCIFTFLYDYHLELLCI